MTGQRKPWEQIADVAEKKAKDSQYLEGFVNLLIVESDSDSLAMMCESAAHEYDDRAQASDDPRLRRLSGILLVNKREMKLGAIPSNVEFCRTECAAVPLTGKLGTALNSIRLG